MSHDLAQNSMMMAWRSEQMGSLVSCQSTLWAMASTAFPRCLPKGGHAVRQCAGCGLLQSTISTLLVTLVMLKSRGRRCGSGNVDECHIYHNIPHDQVHGMYSDWYTGFSHLHPQMQWRECKNTRTNSQSGTSSERERVLLGSRTQILLFPVVLAV